MKKSLAFGSLLLLITLMSSCKEESLPSFGGSSFIRYFFSPDEIMSGLPFSEDNLTAFISLDNIDIYEDILLKSKKDNNVPVTREVDILDIFVKNASLDVISSEPNLFDTVNSLLISAELVMSSPSNTAEIILAEYTVDGVSGTFELTPTTRDIVDDVKDGNFDYFFRLKFSEVPEAEFIQIIPNLSLDFEYDSIEE